jgi:hypothetical protein
MAVVAVDGDEELRPEQVDHEALLFLAEPWPLTWMRPAVPSS